MFASNDLFDEEVQLDGKSNAAYQNSRPMTATSRAGASTTFERQNSIGGAASASSSNDPTTPTPAMRKAKMEEMRRAQLDKQRMKNMVAPAILRANEDQVVKSPVGATAAAAAVSPQMSPGPYARQPSDLGRGGSASPYAQASPTGSRQLDFSARGDSDDEEGGVAIAAYASPTGSHGSQHISSLLAEKQQSQRGSGSSAADVAAASAAIGGVSGMSQAEREMLQQGIAPVFDPVTLSRGQPGGSPKVGPQQQSYVPHARLDLSDMRTFLQTPVPKGAPLLCYILRNKKGLMNKMYPTYEAYLSGDQERFLFGARKRTKNKTSNYLISLDKNEIGSGKESASYLGKVRSNFAGTEFVGYDKGCNPKDLPSATPQDSSIRAELCAVFYQSNLFGSNGPRKMTAVLPSLYRADGTTSGRAPPLRPIRPEDSIAERYKLHPQSSEFVTLVNKTPQWNESVGAYVLDFNKRVTMASVKNFQLIQADEPDRVVLQFGRIGKDTFTMDVQHPMTPMQAFQICLTSFDYKFACE